MSTDFFEADVERLAPGRYTDVQRLGVPGTSGTVFRAYDRQRKQLVAIKISHAEDSAKGSLLAEAAALSVPEIRDAAEPDSAPTARQLLDHLDVFARVGLVLEWLDESYRSVEDLVREPDRKFSELQVLRILAPLTALLAAAHRAGWVYVDIGARKADHLWWRVTREDGGQPSFQLKVIDWANALKMTDPGYSGDVGPAHDIAGVGELLFYLSRGPNVPLPASPADLSPSSPFDDLIRRALFAEAEDSFVREAQKQRNVTAAARTTLLRDPDLRAAATEDLDHAVHSLRDSLATRHGHLVETARQTVAHVQAAAERGLLPLNGAIAQEVRQLYGDSAPEATADPNTQAAKLSDRVRETVERARKIDPDGPDLTDSLAQLDTVLVARRGLENVRRLLGQGELDRVPAALTRVPQQGIAGGLADDRALLDTLAAALQEVAALPHEPREVEADKALLPGLIEQMLDGTGASGSPGAAGAADTLRGLKRWGSGPAVRNLRIAVGRRAGAALLRDEAAHLLDLAAAVQQDADTTDPARSAGARNLLASAARSVSERAASLRQALEQLAARDAEPALPLLSSLQTTYVVLADAVRNLLSLQVLPVGDSLPLQTTLDQLLAALDTAGTALDEGNLTIALDALRTWAALDPESALAPRYNDALARHPELDRQAILAELRQASLTDVERLLKQAPAALDAIRPVAPRATYRVVLSNLAAVYTPLLDAIGATRAVRGSRTEHIEFAEAVGGALPGALAEALRDDPAAPGRLRPETRRLADRDVFDPQAEGKRLAAYYNEINDWQSPPTYPLTADDLRGVRLPDLLAALADGDRKLPGLPAISRVYRQFALRACAREATTGLAGQDFAAAASWFAALELLDPSGEVRGARQAAEVLASAEQIWNEQGPHAALRVAAPPGVVPPGAGRYQAPLRQAQGTLRDLADRQARLLDNIHVRLAAVPGQPLPDAATTLNSILADVSVQAARDSDEVARGLSARAVRWSLQQDLEPLYRLWRERLAPAPVAAGYGAGNGGAVSQDVLASLAGGLDTVLPATNAPPGDNAPVARAEVLHAVYQPLAAALRHIAAQPLPPGAPPSGGAAGGNGAGWVPGGNGGGGGGPTWGSLAWAGAGPAGAMALVLPPLVARPAPVSPVPAAVRAPLSTAHPVAPAPVTTVLPTPLAPVAPVRRSPGVPILAAAGGVAVLLLAALAFLVPSFIGGAATQTTPVAVQTQIAVAQTAGASTSTAQARTAVAESQAQQSATAQAMLATQLASAKTVADAQTVIAGATYGAQTATVETAVAQATMVAQRTVETAAQQTTSTTEAVAAATQIAATAAANKTAAAVAAANKTAAAVAAGKTASAVAAGKTASAVTAGKTASAVAAGKTASAVAAGKTASAVAANQTAVALAATQAAKAATTEPAKAATTEPAKAATTEPAKAATTEPAKAATTEPAKAATTEPAKAATTEPAKAATTEPAKAATTEPAKAATTEPAKATTTPSLPHLMSLLPTMPIGEPSTLQVTGQAKITSNAQVGPTQGTFTLNLVGTLRLQFGPQIAAFFDADVRARANVAPAAPGATRSPVRRRTHP